MKKYTLRIYASDARTIIRETVHDTRTSAYSSLVAYERRHNQHFASDISETEQPHRNDAAGWDRYRVRQGVL
jgi:hypothetical protein